jgi:branched-chain amino acid transport system substrate-binding protein
VVKRHITSTFSWGSGRALAHERRKTVILFSGFQPIMRLLQTLASRVVILVLASSSIAPLTQAQEKQIVGIGLIYPLTGAMSSFGDDMAKSLPLLERKFNAEQSKYKFTLSIEDGKFGQSNAAITAAHKLVDVDGVRFIVVGSSGEVLQIAPFVEAAHVLTVAGFASHPAIKNAGDYIFRTYIDIDNGIGVVVDDLSKKKITRLAVFTEESSFTSAVRDSLSKRLGNKIVFSESYSIGDFDLKTLIAKARSKTPQAYYLNTTAPSGFISLLKQLRDSQTQEPFYTYYVPTIKEVQDGLGSKLDGTLYLDYPDTDASDDFKSFASEFERANGVIAKAPFNFRTNYNAIKVIFDAIINVGPDPTKVRDFLYSYDRPSATGRLRFNKNGDAEDLNLVLKTYISK